MLPDLWDLMLETEARNVAVLGSKRPGNLRQSESIVMVRADQALDDLETKPSCLFRWASSLLARGGHVKLTGDPPKIIE